VALLWLLAHFLIFRRIERADSHQLLPQKLWVTPIFDVTHNVSHNPAIIGIAAFFPVLRLRAAYAWNTPRESCENTR